MTKRSEPALLLKQKQGIPNTKKKSMKSNENCGIQSKMNAK